MRKMAKIRLTEAQFKAYCRKLLNEKRSEDYVKGILTESYYGWEEKNGKYYVYSNGVRHQVSKETWEQTKKDAQEEKHKNLH